MTNKLPVDDLYLEKHEILDVVDAIIQHWKKNKMANWQYIATLNGFKMALSIMPNDMLRVIWRQVITAFTELYSLSEMKRLEGERPNAKFFKDTLMAKIKSGELFGPQ